MIWIQTTWFSERWNRDQMRAEQGVLPRITRCRWANIKHIINLCRRTNNTPNFKSQNVNTNMTFRTEKGEYMRGRRVTWNAVGATDMTFADVVKAEYIWHKRTQINEKKAQSKRVTECMIDIDDSYWLTHTERLWLRHRAGRLPDRKATKSTLLSFQVFGSWMWEWTVAHADVMIATSLKWSIKGVIDSYFSVVIWHRQGDLRCEMLGSLMRILLEVTEHAGPAVLPGRSCVCGSLLSQHNGP